MLLENLPNLYFNVKIKEIKQKLRKMKIMNLFVYETQIEDHLASTTHCLMASHKKSLKFFFESSGSDKCKNDKTFLISFFMTTQ